MEGRVDKALCGRTGCPLDVTAPAKHPAFKDPFGDHLGQLRPGMVKHDLQGKLQCHNTFVVIRAKYRVVDLDQTVSLPERHRPLLTVVGCAAHGIHFAAAGALCPIHTLRPQAALGIQPQRVGVIALKQQSTCVGLHPRVVFAAIGRNSGNAVVERLDLAPPNLHATMCEVAIVLRGTLFVARSL